MNGQPQFFNLDPQPNPAPPWVQDLRDMFQVGQEDVLKELKSQGRNLHQVTEQCRSLIKNKRI